MRFVVGLTVVLLSLNGPSYRHTNPPPNGSHYLFLWTRDSAGRASDFLAVVDVDSTSPAYAQVVATLPVGVIGSMPHHTEHQMSSGGVLFVNGFMAGRTFRIDLRDPTRPKLLGSFGDAGPYTHPHSYVRLPNGNVLSTFQMRIDAGRETTGGLVELSPDGQVLRTASAAAPTIDSAIRPYSLAILPALDRVVTTATDMHGALSSRAVQVWRLSDLHLLHTILLPPGPRGDENFLTAEPRVLTDGRTVMVNTFKCGLYRLSGLDSDQPAADWVYTAPWKSGENCAIPLTTGRFWVQTVGAEHALVSLDISDPLHPKEVSRLTLGLRDVPHWISLEPNGKRIVITGYDALYPRVLLARFDRRTGALALDSSFKDRGAVEPGISFARTAWPHGSTGTGIPHGAVFSLPDSHN
jgi:hypothetical protein